MISISQLVVVAADNNEVITSDTLWSLGFLIFAIIVLGIIIYKTS